MANETVSQHLGSTQSEDDYLTVPHHYPAGWRRDEWGGAMLSDLQAASASMATDGIQAIAAVLLQQEVDRDCTGPACLRLGTATTVGLIEALSSCTELIKLQLQAGAVAKKAPFTPAKASEVHHG